MVLQRFIFSVLILGCLLVVGWIWFWFYAADQFAAQLSHWAASRRAQGYEVSYHLSETEGFPTRLKASAEAPRIFSPTGWRWEGPLVTAQSAALNPLYLRVAAPGRHLVSVPYKAETVSVDILAGAADLDLWLNTWGELDGLRFLLDGIDLKAVPLGKFQLDAGELLLRAGKQEDGTPLDSLDFSLDATALQLPGQLGSPLGNIIERAVADGTLQGKPPQKATREALLQWRERSGRVDLQRLYLQWGPLGILAEGEIRLDQELRPEADLRAEVTGFSAVIRALEAKRIIKTRVALGANLALAALARVDPETGVAVVTLPVKIREGRVYLGPVALFRISPVL